MVGKKNTWNTKLFLKPWADHQTLQPLPICLSLCSRPALLWCSWVTVNQAAGRRCVRKPSWRPLSYVLGSAQALSLGPCLSCVVDMPTPSLILVLDYVNWLDFEPMNICCDCGLVWVAMDCGWPWLSPPDLLCFSSDSVGPTPCWWGHYPACLAVTLCSWLNVPHRAAHCSITIWNFA